MVGEHIRALRSGRWDHAIDCGDETVIHLPDADGDAAPARVRRSYRPEFVSGADAVEVVTHRERTFAASEVVARAYSRIAEPGLASMFRDSEAFAEWCVTGRLPLAPPNVVAAGAPNVAVAAPAARASAKPARPNGVREPAKAAKAAAKPRASTKKAARGSAKRGSAKRAAAKRAAAKPAARARKATRRPAPRKKAKVRAKARRR